MVLYNPKLIKEAPTGIDALDPKKGNKVGIVDIQYVYTTMAAALAAAARGDFDKAKKVLLS